MDITIQPGKLAGQIQVIPSKSQAHRLLILSAFADRETVLLCRETSRDMDATAQCLVALGAGIDRTEQGYRVTPARAVPQSASLFCQDSGSTLRFLLPVVGALGVDATFHMTGRLPNRPLSPLWEELERMGCQLSRPTESTLRCQGQLRAGSYSMDGSISSQFITGLLLAMPLIDGESTLKVTGKVESRPYIALTEATLALFGGNALHSPGEITVEGDWSNGAFFLAANALGSDLEILSLSDTSVQGDRAASTLIPQLMQKAITISAADIPDLVPILSVVAAAHHGAVFTDIGRLRLKESDRVASVIAMLTALGGSAQATANTLTVHPAHLTGGTVDAMNDHRIAMSAAIAATVCTGPITVLGAEAVHKSYPQFWEEYRRLGGLL